MTDEDGASGARASTPAKRSDLSLLSSSTARRERSNEQWHVVHDLPGGKKRLNNSQRIMDAPDDVEVFGNYWLFPRCTGSGGSASNPNRHLRYALSPGVEFQGGEEVFCPAAWDGNCTDNGFLVPNSKIYLPERGNYWAIKWMPAPGGLKASDLMEYQCTYFHEDDILLWRTNERKPIYQKSKVPGTRAWTWNESKPKVCDLKPQCSVVVSDLQSYLVLCKDAHNRGVWCQPLDQKGHPAGTKFNVVLLHVEDLTAENDMMSNSRVAMEQARNNQIKKDLRERKQAQKKLEAEAAAAAGGIVIPGEENLDIPVVVPPLVLPVDKSVAAEDEQEKQLEKPQPKPKQEKQREKPEKRAPLAPLEIGSEHNDDENEENEETHANVTTILQEFGASDDKSSVLMASEIYNLRASLLDKEETETAAKLEAMYEAHRHLKEGAANLALSVDRIADAAFKYQNGGQDVERAGKGLVELLANLSEHLTETRLSEATFKCLLEKLKEYLRMDVGTASSSSADDQRYILLENSLRAWFNAVGKHNLPIPQSIQSTAVATPRLDAAPLPLLTPIHKRPSVDAEKEKEPQVVLLEDDDNPEENLATMESPENTPEVTSQSKKSVDVGALIAKLQKIKSNEGGKKRKASDDVQPKKAKKHKVKTPVINKSPAVIGRDGTPIKRQLKVAVQSAAKTISPASLPVRAKSPVVGKPKETPFPKIQLKKGGGTKPNTMVVSLRDKTSVKFPDTQWSKLDKDHQIFHSNEWFFFQLNYERVAFGGQPKDSHQEVLALKRLFFMFPTLDHQAQGKKNLLQFFQSSLQAVTIGKQMPIPKISSTGESSPSAAAASEQPKRKHKKKTKKVAEEKQKKSRAPADPRLKENYPYQHPAEDYDENKELWENLIDSAEMTKLIEDAQRLNPHIGVMGTVNWILPRALALLVVDPETPVLPENVPDLGHMRWSANRCKKDVDAQRINGFSKQLETCQRYPWVVGIINQIKNQLGTDFSQSEKDQGLSVVFKHCEAYFKVAVHRVLKAQDDVAEGPSTSDPAKAAKAAKKQLRKMAATNILTTQELLDIQTEAGLSDFESEDGDTSGDECHTPKEDTDDTDSERDEDEKEGSSDSD